MEERVEEPHNAACAGRRRLAQAWLAGASIACSTLAPPCAAAEDCKVTAVEMPVTMEDSRAIATVEINGKEVRLLVDSGAFFSFLTRSAAQQLQLPVGAGPANLQARGLTGRLDTGVTTVKQLKLLKGEIPDVEFMVGGNELGHGTFGILGRNLLEFTDTEYDLAHGMIRFMFPVGDCSNRNMAYWAGLAPVSQIALRHDWSSTKLPAILANAKLNGVDVRAMFDTGATSLVSLKTARNAGVKDADMTPNGRTGGAGLGRVDSWIAPIASFEIGGELIRNSKLGIDDFDMDDSDADMLLGIDFFLSHRIYVSAKHRQMFFTYNGGPVFARNTAAAASAAASGAAEPVDAEQPADAAGFARRGAAFASRNDYVHALADLDRACAMAPQDPVPFARRASVRASLHQPVEALKDLYTALRLDPALVEPRLQRAGLRVDTGDRAGALDDLHALDKSIAPQAQEHSDLAALYLSAGDAARSVSEWTLWIDTHGGDNGRDRALNGRCWARALGGIELDKALDDCNAAIGIEPGLAAYMDSRGWLHLRRGERGDAMIDFDRSLKLKPDLASSLYGRGIAQVRLGRAEPGRTDVAAARKLNPELDREMRTYGLAAEFAAVPGASTSAVTPASASTTASAPMPVK